MRTRQIKPGFFKNEILAACAPHARLLFTGLWMLADREGRLEDRPLRIKGELFPYEDINVNDLLQVLTSQINGAGQPELLIRYSTAAGKFIQIVNFLKHQQPHYKEVPSSIQPPPDWRDSEYLGGGVPESVRIAVIERDGKRCKSCQSPRDLTVDHIVPRSRGGSNEESNLQTLCRKCNSAKNNRVSAQTQVNVGATSGRRRRKRSAPFPPLSSSLIPSSLTPNSSNKEKNKDGRFAPPLLREVISHTEEKNLHFDPVGFWNYYESVGWRVGNKPMKKWRAACVTWETRWKNDHPELQPSRRGPLCTKCLVRPPSEDPPSQFCPSCLEGILAESKRMGVEVE